MEINKKLFKNLTILYVEDDPMTLEEVSFFLKKCVKTLYTAKNGKEGLELFKQYKVDMVISDIQMPIMNGLEMSEKIFQISKDVPIAITTAFSDSNYIIKAIELGIDKYIIKPINMQEILAVIQKSLNLKSTQVYDEYIQFILDSSPNFMFIMHNNDIQFASSEFMNLLGYESLDNFNETIKQSKDLLFLNKKVDEKNWFDYVCKNENEKHLVTLKSSKKDFSKQFYVNYKNFPHLGKKVFVFTNAKDESLKKINLLSNDILKKVEKTDLNRVILEQVEAIRLESKV